MLTDRQRVSKSANQRVSETHRFTVVIAVALAASCSLLLASPLIYAQSVPDPRFGAVEAFRDPQAASDLNLGWERMLFYWSELKRNGPDDAWNIYHVPDGWLDDARKHGREVIGVIESTPPWATDGHAGGGVPRGLYLPIDDANNLWAGFVRELVSRYAGIVNHWVIWNEPDIEPPDDGVQFDGSVADYYQLVKVAYLVAKQANPNAVIHLAGLTYHHDVVHKRVPYLQRFLDEAKQDPTAPANHFYFDVATLHIYFNVDSVYDITQTFFGILRRNGLSKPIWINETNAAPSNDPQNPWTAPLFITDLDQQANFIVQAFAIGLAAGAERVAVYKLSDSPPYPPGFPAFGLVRADGSRRPAYDALKLVTTYFRTTRTARIMRTKPTEIVTLDRGGQTTYIAWARTNVTATVALPASAPQALLVGLDGITHTLTAVNGRYALTLPAAKCNDPNYGCTIGGTPLIVVEEAAAHTAPAIVQTEPIVTATATSCVDCTATPTNTPRPTRTASRTPTATSSVTPPPSPTVSITPSASPTLRPTNTATSIPTATPSPLPTFIPTSTPSNDAPMEGSGLLIVGLIIEFVVVVGMLWLAFSRKKR